MFFQGNYKQGSFATTSGPAAVNLDLGFIPDYFQAYAADATAAVIEMLLYLGSAGTGIGWKSTIIVDSGTTGNKNLEYVSSSFITEYTQTKAMEIKQWAASTAYVTTDYVIPKAPISPDVVGLGEQYVFHCTSAGTSGSTEPTWSTDGSSTVSDSGVTWTPVAYGGSSTSFVPSQYVIQAKGVSIPSALLKASTTYHYVAFKQA